MCTWRATSSRGPLWMWTSQSASTILGLVCCFSMLAIILLHCSCYVACDARRKQFGGVSPASSANFSANAGLAVSFILQSGVRSEHTYIYVLPTSAWRSAPCSGHTDMCDSKPTPPVHSHDRGPANHCAKLAVLSVLSIQEAPMHS